MAPSRHATIVVPESEFAARRIGNYEQSPLSVERTGDSGALTRKTRDRERRR